MNPDSTFMSDMTGTRDKGVGTRAEVTGRQWLVARPLRGSDRWTVK